MREILENFEKLTQGSIFYNAKSNEYDENVYGILINGRCDIEHPQHYDTLLYLPIVPFDDWELKYSTKKILIQKHNEILNILEGFRNLFSYKAILYLPEHKEEIINRNLKKEKDREKVRKAIQFMTLHREFESNKDLSLSDIKAFKEAFFSDFDGIKKQLIENNLPDAYYLENVDFQDQEAKKLMSWVVLITEIHSIPRKALENIEKGIDLGREAHLKPYFGTDGLVVPCATLKSPFVEHLIQKVVSLFRVGVERAEYFD